MEYYQYIYESIAPIRGDKMYAKGLLHLFDPTGPKAYNSVYRLLTVSALLSAAWVVSAFSASFRSSDFICNFARATRTPLDLFSSLCKHLHVNRRMLSFAYMQFTHVFFELLKVKAFLIALLAPRFINLYTWSFFTLAHVEGSDSTTYRTELMLHGNGWQF